VSGEHVGHIGARNRTKESVGFVVQEQEDEKREDIF
jgi:hypothetical protein